MDKGKRTDIIPIAVSKAMNYNKGIQKLLEVGHSWTESKNKLARR